MIRRFQCRLGSAPRRGGGFRPLVSRRAAQLHQSSRAISNFLCAPAFSSACSELRSGGVCGQHDNAGLPAESGGHQICGFKPDGSGSNALGGAPFHLHSASVHHGAQQRVGRFSLSSKSDSGFRVDPETVCVSAASEKVAGVNRPVRNLTLFFSIPRSQCSGDRCSSPTVEWVAGICLSSLRADSYDSEKAPLVLWGPADNHSSLLAPEALVSGASGACSGRSGGFASGQGSVEPASCSSTASGSVKASSSCVETIQRFIRSHGFSRHVAKQAAMAR